MKLHVATIKDAHRRENEAFDSSLIVFSVPVSETSTKTFNLEIINNPFLLSHLFDFTSTTNSEDITNLIGKSIRICVDGPSAIGHPTEDRFVILNIDKEFTLEDLEKI